MTKYEYIEILKNIFFKYIGDYDYNNNNVFRFLYCPLICQGYSKNKKGHFEVNFDEGVCYCHRCYNGTTLYNILNVIYSSNKNDSLLKNIIESYHKFYNHKTYKNTNNSYVTLDSLKTTSNIVINLSDIVVKYINKRFIVNDKDEIKKLLLTFKFNAENDRMWYTTLFCSKSIFYTINKDLSYVKHRQRHNENKIDYYYNILNINNKNLVIAEGLTDLITYYLTRPYNLGQSFNYLALCGKDFSNLYTFLLISGNFYYDNIYLILDNDVKYSDYIVNIINILSNKRYNPKYKLYNNIYTILPKPKYIDLNEQYMNHDFEFKIDKLINL